MKKSEDKYANFDPEKLLEDARDILAEQVLSRNEEEGLFEKPQEICPRCKSDHIEDSGPAGDGLLHVNCRECSYYWAEPDEMN